MLICPACHTQVPDNLTSCPACAMQKSDAAVLAAQREYFIRVRRGDWAFISCRDRTGTIHLRMFGHRVDKSFCGIPLALERRHLGSVAWDEQQLAKICAGCRVAVKRIMTEEIETLPADVTEAPEAR